MTTVDDGTSDELDAWTTAQPVLLLASDPLAADGERCDDACSEGCWRTRSAAGIDEPPAVEPRP